MRAPTIWINGEKGSWKRIADEYGNIYCDELKEAYKNADMWTTIYSEDGLIEISK